MPTVNCLNGNEKLSAKENLVYNLDLQLSALMLSVMHFSSGLKICCIAGRKVVYFFMMKYLKYLKTEYMKKFEIQNIKKFLN